LFLFSNL